MATQSSLYVVTPGSNDVATDLNQLVTTAQGTQDAGLITDYQPLAAPGAPTVAVGSGSGNLNGTYQYLVTFRTGGVDGAHTLHASGETAAGTASAVVSPVNQPVAVSAIPIGPPGTIARNLYRTKAGGTVFYFLLALADNTTTTVTDNLPDSSLGTTTAPTVNTTGTVRQLAVYPAVPGYLPPVGTLAAVQPPGGPSTVWQAQAGGWLSLVGSIGSVTDLLLTTTTSTAVLTAPAGLTGLYTLWVYARIGTAATDLTLSWTWTDPAGTWTITVVSGLQGVGPVLVAPIPVLLSAGSSATLTATAGTPNQCWITARLVAA